MPSQGIRKKPNVNIGAPVKNEMKKPSDNIMYEPFNDDKIPIITGNAKKPGFCPIRLNAAICVQNALF